MDGDGSVGSTSLGQHHVWQKMNNYYKNTLLPIKMLPENSYIKALASTEEMEGQRGH